MDPATPLTRELEINGEIQQGQLTLSCRYSGARYRDASVQRLLDSIGDALVELLSPPAETVTPAAGMDGRQLNPLVRLAEGRTGSPTLFCPHPVSGTVVGYYPLAGRLAPDWTIWGMQNRQIVDARWRDGSLTAMARDYVRTLLDQQPQGPYYLLGWSMGGSLVLEMATLLERLGKTVAFVGLIDGYVPGAGQERTDNQPDAVPEGVSEDEWQQLLAVERHMRQLARGHKAVRPLRAPVHAWWASRSPENNDNAEVLLEQAMGQPLASSTWLDTDHLGIVRHDGFLAALVDRLNSLGLAHGTAELQD